MILLCNYYLAAMNSDWFIGAIKGTVSSKAALALGSVVSKHKSVPLIPLIYSIARTQAYSGFVISAGTPRHKAGTYLGCLEENRYTVSHRSYMSRCKSARIRGTGANSEVLGHTVKPVASENPVRGVKPSLFTLSGVGGAISEKYN